MTTAPCLPHRVMEVAAASFQEGMSLFKKGAYSEAFTHFLAASEHDPDFADAFYHLGLIYQHQQDFNLADRYFRMALMANENHFGAQAQLGMVDEAAEKAQPKAKPLSDQEFFVRLAAEQSESAKNLIEAIETSGLVPKLERKGVWVDRTLDYGAKFLINLIPAALGGFFVGSVLYAMGLGSFTMLSSALTAVFFLLRIVQKNM